VAKSIYGAGSDLGEQWAKKRRDDLDEGKLDEILAALHVHAETNDEARKCLDYVTTNRHRMRYPEFRAQGLCVSTGVVEAGCKTAIGARCKRAGMHWTVAGADAIIALRCCKLSGRFEDFWERRALAAGSRAKRDQPRSTPEERELKRCPKPPPVLRASAYRRRRQSRQSMARIRSSSWSTASPGALET
jgi:hypothetical protein